MATTTNLAVTKIDSAQAQKEVTANQAFDVFDAALSEKAITMTDANYTLSTSTTPKEWQYGIIKLSGTLTANRNVVAPTNKKEYTVVNDTTGGFSIVFKTSAGTGVTVTNGSIIKVRCDGTNVVAVTPLTVQPFDISAYYPGPPASSAFITRIPIARAVTFAANFSGSYYTATTNAAASTVFDVQKNGSSIGSITIAAGTTTATFATTGGTSKSFVAGDVLAIIAPASPDATLNDPGFTLVGTR